MNRIHPPKPDQNSEECNMNVSHIIRVDGGTECLSATLDLSRGLTRSNDDEYRITLEATGGQPLKVNGLETDQITITITGDWEMRDFFYAMGELDQKFRKAA